MGYHSTHTNCIVRVIPLRRLSAQQEAFCLFLREEGGTSLSPFDILDHNPLLQDVKEKHIKRATSVRLTPEAKRLMAVIAKKLGVSQSAVPEVAIRPFAKNEGIKDNESKNQ